MFIGLLDSRKSRDFLYMRGFPDGRIPGRSLPICSGTDVSTGAESGEPPGSKRLSSVRAGQPSMSRRKPDVFSSHLGLQTGVERLFSALSLPELIRQEPLADPYMLPLRHADPVRSHGRLLFTK